MVMVPIGWRVVVVKGLPPPLNRREGKTFKMLALILDSKIENTKQKIRIIHILKFGGETS